MNNDTPTNAIGKFQIRDLMNTFDATLIQLFGVNMLDAKISRYQALDAVNEFQCPRKAAENLGVRRGLALRME